MLRSSSLLRLLVVALCTALPAAAPAQEDPDALPIPIEELQAAPEVDEAFDADVPESEIADEDEFDDVPRAAAAAAAQKKAVRPNQPVVTPPTEAAAKKRAASATEAAPKNPVADGAKAPPAPLPGSAAPLKVLQPIQTAAATEADLEAAFAAFREAAEKVDVKAQAAAQQRLVALKEDLGVTGLDAVSMAIARAAQKRQEAKDDLAAVELAKVAVALAPDLPWAQFALAKASFVSDPAELSRWAGPLWETLASSFRDPRYLRPGLADLGAALVAALVFTATAVILLLAVRRLRYFLHDFHHLFPKAAARWQTAPLALLLLFLPAVFRLGVVPVLATLFAAVVLYLDVKERIVGAALLALLGISPLLAQGMTELASFGGTPAERVYRVERGGLDAAGAADGLRERVGTGEATFAELYALARYDLQRGRLNRASDLMKKAALLRPNDARLTVLLGNARFGVGDLDGAAAHYRRARELDPGLAAASWNLSRVHYRNAAAAHDAARAVELERAQTAQSQAQLADASLLGRTPPPEDEVRLNRLVLSPSLAWSELAPLASVPGAGKQVADQLAWRLLGTNSTLLAWLLPGLLALGAVGLGALRHPLSASRVCDKCGRAVCRRCDPELGLASSLCGQCVNVFARKGLVAPQVKLRKQIEVDRYQTRSDRVAWLFGILCSGGGHLVSGVPVRGALFLFSFLFLLGALVLREGVVRAPYGELPVWLRLLPALVALVAVYLISLRSLRRTQAG